MLSMFRVNFVATIVAMVLIGIITIVPAIPMLLNKEHKVMFIASGCSMLAYAAWFLLTLATMLH